MDKLQYVYITDDFVKNMKSQTTDEALKEISINKSDYACSEILHYKAGDSFNIVPHYDALLIKTTGYITINEYENLNEYKILINTDKVLFWLPLCVIGYSRYGIQFSQNATVYGIIYDNSIRHELYDQDIIAIASNLYISSPSILYSDCGFGPKINTFKNEHLKSLLRSPYITIDILQDYIHPHLVEFRKHN